MNKITRKCPNCGATVPADVKYCRKCHARVDSGRVEILDKPEKSQPRKRSGDNDALRDLPRPVRPVEDDGYSEQPEGGYAAAAGAAGSKRKMFDRSGRGGESGGRAPRPVSTARGGDGAAYADSGSNRTLWQIIAVLGVILVIVIVAIFLVIRLNRPADSANTSDPYENAQVITSSTMAPSPTPAGTPEPESTPEGLIVPDATPVPSPKPSATPMPMVTAVPTAVPAATPTPAANNFNVTAASGTVKVTNASGANLRSGPGDTYNVQATVGVNTQLTRTGTSGSWTQVNYNGQTLFIFTNLLDIGSGSSGGSNNSSSSGSNYTVTADSGTGTVTGNGVNIRSGPGTGYGVIGSANKGNTLTITGYSGSWYRVNYNGQNGFISSQYLSKGGSSSSGGSTSSGTTGTVTGNGVNIRSGPGTSYSSIGSASKGATVSILGQSGDWYQIKYGNTTGYMSAQYVSKN